MHLIKLVACKTLQSFQSGFYAQFNFQKKERFLASFLMGTFAHLEGLVLGPENHTKTGFVPRCLHSQIIPACFTGKCTFTQWHVAKKDTEAIVTRLDAPKSQK